MAANLHNNLRARMNAMPQRPPPHQNPYRANQQPQQAPQQPAGPPPRRQPPQRAPPHRPPPPHAAAAPAGGAPPPGPPPRRAPAGRAPPHRPAPAGRAPPAGPAPAGAPPPHRPPPARAGPRARAAAPPRGPPPGRRAGAPPPPPPPHRPAAHAPAGVPPMPPVPPPYVRPGAPPAPQPAVIPGTGIFPAPPPADAVPGAVPLHQQASGHGVQQQQDEKYDGVLGNQSILNDIILGISNFDDFNPNFFPPEAQADRRRRMNNQFNLNSLNVHLRTGRSSPMDNIYDSLNGGRAGRNNPLAGSEEQVFKKAQDSLRLNQLKHKLNEFTKNGGGQDVADRLSQEIENIEKKLNQKRGYLNNAYGPSRGSGLSTGQYGDNTRMLYFLYLFISFFFSFLFFLFFCFSLSFF